MGGREGADVILVAVELSPFVARHLLGHLHHELHSVITPLDDPILMDAAKCIEEAIERLATTARPE